MILTGKSGLTYRLDRTPFAKGGEGEIYLNHGRGDIVIKIYKQNIDLGGREEKLLSMVEHPPEEEQRAQIAWPMDVVYDSGNKFVGFVMPKLEVSEDLNVLYEYGPTSKYPDLPWSSKVVIAQNLCAVVHSIHEAGHVIGDFNPKNISVNPNTGRVVMLDTDSYHIDGGKFKCLVGLPDYLPLEVQRKMKGTGLATAKPPTFTKESDNFALAIHIFQLLMNGVHPFACALLPGLEHIGASMPSDNILKNHTPFFLNISGRTTPKFAPTIKILPKGLRKLFRRAFVAGHKSPKARPTTKDWHSELEKLKISIQKCQRFHWHEFPKKLGNCPWCSADKRFKETRKKHGKVIKEGEKQRHKKKLADEQKELDKMIKEVYGKQPKLSEDIREILMFAGALISVTAALFVALWLLGLL